MSQETTSTTTNKYIHPEVLCETDWIADNLKNPKIRILEVDYDPENAYKQGHIPGAHLVWWKRDINDPVRRDIISKQQFEELMSRVGAEKRYWHYHLTELPRVNATLPDMTSEEAAAVKPVLDETYGKVVYFWQYGDELPIGEPRAIIIEDIVEQAEGQQQQH